MKAKILLVDDEENILKEMRSVLEAEYDVFTASNESDAITKFERERVAVVTLDLSLNPGNHGDLSGLRLLERRRDVLSRIDQDPPRSRPSDHILRTGCVPAATFWAVTNVPMPTNSPTTNGESAARLILVAFLHQAGKRSVRFLRSAKLPDHALRDAIEQGRFDNFLRNG